MLITVSFPITDCRKLLNIPLRHINVSSNADRWLNGRGFIRSFGGIRQRYHSSEYLPMNDDRYFNAHHGLRFQRQQPDPESISFDCVFRRLFAADYSVRLDVGLTPRRNSALPTHNLEDLVKKALDIKVYGNDDLLTQKRKDLPLRDFHYSKSFMDATTFSKETSSRELRKWWLDSRTPVVVAACRYRDQYKLNRSHFVKIRLPEYWDLRLYYRMTRTGIPLWVIEAGKFADKERFRSLRAWLIKWHQEKESFLSVMSLISSEKFTGEKSSRINVEEFSQCLQNLLKTMGKKTNEGFPKTDVANTIASISRQIEPNVEEKFISFLETHEETKHLIRRTYAAMTNNFPFKNLKLDSRKPVIFISHTLRPGTAGEDLEKEDREWVTAFASYLETRGFITILDQVNLPYGVRLPEFMEKALSVSDFVFCICTPEYKVKADDRSGGVGYETNIITAEVYEDHASRRFIPVFKFPKLRRQSTPLWAGGLKGVSLDKDAAQCAALNELLLELKEEFEKKQ